MCRNYRYKNTKYKNVYMPILDELIHNINELSAVLIVFSNLIYSYDDYQILIEGDFN